MKPLLPRFVLVVVSGPLAIPSISKDEDESTVHGEEHEAASDRIHESEAVRKPRSLLRPRSIDRTLGQPGRPKSLFHIELEENLRPQLEVANHQVSSFFVQAGVELC